MPFTTSDAARYGYLVQLAQDMFSVGRLAPPDDSRILAAAWQVVAHMRGKEPELSEQNVMVSTGEEVFFGFVARSKANPNLYVVAIRGTGDLVEWAIDAQFVPEPFAGVLGATVERGFFGLYLTMRLFDLQGQAIGENAVEGVLQLIGEGSIVVTGHSLGAAIATYFSLALARAAPARVQAVLLASPRPGNKAFADHYAATVRDYALFNYSLDIVPRVPFTLGLIDYAPLPGANVFGPHGSEADIHVEIGCNHYILDYVAMLDYPYSQSLAMSDTPGDAGTRGHCVLGPRSWSLNDDLAGGLEFLIDTFEVEAVVRSFAKRFPVVKPGV